MRNAGLEETEAGIKIARININKLRYADDTTLMAESEEELKKASWWKWKRRVKGWLKVQHSENEDHGIRSHHFMEIDGETVKKVSDFIFLGSKITADGDYSHEIKTMLTPWKESYDQPRQHVKKQRHYLADKGPSSQSYGFSSSHV